MSEKLKPAPLTPEQIATQVQELEKQKKELTLTNNIVNDQLKRVESALKEKDKLHGEVQKKMGEVMFKVEDEWKKKTDLFPDIRLQILIKAEESLNPPKKA